MSEKQRKAERHYRLQNRLIGFGFTFEEIAALLRIEKTLRTWATHECNGAIQRDGENGDGVPYWYNTDTASPHHGERISRTPDREAGALRRLDTLMGRHPAMGYHVPGDPRGAMLYVYSSDEMGSRDPDQCYATAGVCCCID